MLRLLRDSLLIVTLLCAAAAARSEKTFAYPRDQAWPTLVRFLRVDAGVKIVEKDAESGYVLFELKDEGKTWRGSAEVIGVVVEGRPTVKVVIAVPDRPSYVETLMLQKLERKLKAELGSPVPAPAPKKPVEPPKDAPTPAPVDDGGPKISPTP